MKRTEKQSKKSMENANYRAKLIQEGGEALEKFREKKRQDAKRARDKKKEKQSKLENEN